MRSAKVHYLKEYIDGLKHHERIHLRAQFHLEILKDPDLKKKNSFAYQVKNQNMTASLLLWFAEKMSVRIEDFYTKPAVDQPKEKVAA